MRLKGTYTAIVTPFTASEEIDYEALKKLIHEQADAGVAGIVPCGTTGESPTLTHKEHLDVITKVVTWSKEKRSDMAVIAGTGSNSTKEAITLTSAAAEVGADFALVVNPYYNKPTQDGMIQHFCKIADSSKIPIILYNIPGRTSIKLELETIVELSRHENIAGIKEATGDISFMAQIIESVHENFALLSGDDNLLLPILSIGGKGVISVVSNLYPALAVQMTAKYFAGDTEESKKIFYKLFPLMRAMFLESNPIPVKYALSVQKKIQNVLRLPLTPISKQHESSIENILVELEANND
ncbi:MAG: 4-hydroxy-tetrahydrodipicolinate synthase [Leptospirales bacterium]